jgi:hypothetical protein
METVTYHIKTSDINAIRLIEELIQKDTVECIQNDEVPEWQIVESRRRLAEMKANPSSTISHEDFFDSIVDD